MAGYDSLRGFVHVHAESGEDQETQTEQNISWYEPHFEWKQHFFFHGMTID